MPEGTATSADTTTTDTTATTTTDTGGDDTTSTDWQAEAEKWKGLARKHEDRAKENATAAKELEQLRQQSMSEQEKAVATAKAEGRAEAFRDAAVKVVDANVRAATAGRTVDVDALLDGIDRSRFVTDDGDVDTEAIQQWVDKVIPPVSDQRGTPLLDMGQGTRQTGPGLGSDGLLDALKTITGAR